MKILLLCKRYYTNKDLLQDRFGRLYHLPVELAQLGADVSVAAIDYRNPLSEEMAAEGVLFRTAPATPSRLFSLPFHLNRSAQAAKPDIVIASGDSHIGYIAMHLARRLRAHFVFDVYDYYPAFLGNRIPGMKTLFRLAVTAADRVLCASEALQQRMALLNPRTLLIENGVDRHLFVPADMWAVRASLGLAQDITLIGFFGSIAPSKGPLLIEACRILFDQIPSLKLLLAGKVTGVDINKPWIIYRGELPQETVPALIAACDVVAVPLAKHPQNDLSGACKIAEYLACGKPVVATRVSSHEEIFKDAPGSLCEPNPDDIATAIRRQLTNPEIVSFPEHLSWTYIARTLYDELLVILKWGAHAR